MGNELKGTVSPARSGSELVVLSLRVLRALMMTFMKESHGAKEVFFYDLRSRTKPAHDTYIITRILGEAGP